MTAEATHISSTASAARRDQAVHTVRNVRCSPCELAFDVDVAGIAQEVWFRTDAPVTPNADAALAACLLPAVLWGGTLEIDAQISPRLLRNQREFQAIQRLWSRQWDYGLEPLRSVDVRAPARGPDSTPRGTGVATFFSGGVDSWAAIAGNPDVTHVIFVRGLDLVHRSKEFTDAVERRLRDAAAELGKTIYVADTNIREVSDRLLPWGIYFGCPLAAVALLHAPLFDRLLITGDTDYATSIGQGSDALVDHLWSTEQLEIAHVGGALSRIERTRLIADDPVAQRSLRVCWENRDGMYNCGRCRKCLLTTIPLEVFGARESFACFPAELDLDLIGEVEVSNPLVLTLWQDTLDLVRTEGRSDLESPIAALVARGKREFDLPSSYRRRDSPTGYTALVELNRRFEAVVGSRSWRLTAPLRELGRRLRRR